MQNASTPVVTRGRIAALALLACGAFLGSGASPAGAQVSILNTTSVGGQTSWLTSFTTVGEDNRDPARTLRLSMLASHPNGTSIDQLRTDDDWDGTDESGSATLRNVSSQLPSIQGGYGRSRVNFSYSIPTSNTGFSCPLIGTATRRTSNRVFRTRARTVSNVESPVSNSSIRFVASGQCNAHEDWPHIYSWGSNFGTQLTPGQSKNFTYVCDDRDTSGDADCQGIRWRVRNARTGAIVQGPSNSCPNNGDNATKNLNLTFPDRGTYVVEGELSNESCMNATSPGYWFHVGWVDVNSSAAPTLDLNATRPQWNGNTTVTAGNFEDPDDAEGGGVQIIEWDLDGNASNGVNGFEAAPNVATSGTSPRFTTAQNKTVSTVGQPQGLHTVRARVTDNGAMDAADSIRRTRIVSTTYLVDSAPTANAQAVSTESDLAKPITLTGSDPDDDSLSYSIVSGPSNGTLTGSGANRTYTPSGSFAGTDSFVFQVDDGFGRTDQATVTINVTPQTALTSTPGATSGPNSSFEFDSPVTNPTPSFQCKLDGGSFGPCGSPHQLSGLSDGSHTFQVRAVAASQTDPTPASYTWNVDATPPEVTLDTYPDDPTSQTTASFGFHANEPVSGFECELDGGGFDPCTSGVSYPGQGEGSHTFKVRATDVNGNEGDPVEHTWFVDLTGPTAAIDSAPPALNNSTMASFEFSGSDNHSAPGSLGFECRLDGAATFTPCSSPQNYAGLSQGSHTFRVRAIDQAGNVGEPAIHTWTVDTVAPNTAINDDYIPAPPGHGHPQRRTTDPDATFDFFSNDAGASFECRLDNDPNGFEPCSAPVEYLGLPDGPHKFEVRARDQAGNVDQTPAVWEWSVHTGLPDTILDQFPANPSNQASAHFEFHSTAPDSTFVCTLDGGAPIDPCASPQDFAGLSEGQHTFEVVATDEFGREDPSPTTYTWEVDLTAPDTVIDDMPDDPSASDAASFTFHSTEASSSFECQLDDGDWEACDESLPQEYTGLADGEHSFQVRATDQAGNEDPTPASYTWTVDTTAPATTIDDKPGDPSRVVDPSFQFSSDEDPAVEFFCRLDAAPFDSCASGHQVHNLGQGSHTFEVYAVDEAGNVGAVAAYTWYVDLAPPGTTITQSPGALEDTTDATFEFEGSDDYSDTGDLGFECRLNSSDENDFQPCSSGDSFTAQEGDNRFEVRAIDEAGNWDPSPAVYEWTVDITAPTATIADGPADPTNSEDAVFQFSGADNHSAPGDLGFECELDGGGFNPCSSGDDFGPVGEGDHSFKVRAIDEAGNTGPEASYEWTVDQTDPVAQIDDRPDNPTSDGAAVFEFSGTDNHSAPGDLGFECDLDDGGFNACSPGEDFGPVGEGPHSFKVRATDEAGNTSAVATYQWTVDATAPTIDITSGPDALTNDTDASFEFDVDGDPTEVDCKLDDGDFEPCGSPQSYSGLGDGEHTFTVRARDAAGNEETASHDWRIDAIEPETSIDDQPSNPTSSSAAVFQFSGTDNHSAPGDLSFECELDGADLGPCTSDDDFGPVAEGTHTFKVRAIDQAGNTDGTPAEYTWTVDQTAPGVTIDSGPSGIVNVADASFEFSPSGDPTEVECKLDTGAYEACGSPQGYNGLGDGEHTFTVRVKDAAGNEGTDSRTWTVDTGPPETTIDSGPQDGTTSTGASFEFSSNESPATFECALDGGAFEPCTSPHAYGGLSVGSHVFRVQATDAAGNADDSPAVHSWSVAAVPQGGVAGAGGGHPPLIKKRRRSLNVPAKGSFEVAHVICRSSSCTVTHNKAKIKIGGKTYSPEVSTAVVAKGSSEMTKGQVMSVTVHFPGAVQKRLVEEHIGALVVNLEATADSGGAATKKKIRLKAKWLKKLFG